MKIFPPGLGNVIYNSNGNHITKKIIGYLSYGILICFFICLISVTELCSQTGSISGVVTDRDTEEGLFEATVFVIGTYNGAKADENGKYQITNLKPGVYSIRFSYVGYAERIVNNIEVKSNQATKLSEALTPQGSTIDVVEIIGESIIDLESGKSQKKIDAATIRDISVTDVQSIATMQIGVNKTPDGIQIRGGRVYETQYYIDGINAQSRLAGTGFGVDVGKNSIDELEILTGGASAEYGGATSGLVLTKIKEGGDSLQITGSYQRDNLGFNKNQGMSWNTDNFSLSLGFPLITHLGRDSTFRKKKTKEKGLFLFLSGDARFTDEYMNVRANQLHSSIVENSDFFAPRQDNRWSGTFKLTYRVKPGVKISLMNQNSLTINQNTRMLQVVGNQQILTPGYQYAFSQNLDNAQTYTQRSNLTILNFLSTLGERWTMNLTAGRLFSNLRADANGRPFRDEQITQIYDAYSIITDPVTLFNPQDSIIFVNPASGFINNGGIAGRWHDHYEQEYTLKANFNHAPNSKVHYFTFGLEHKEQEFQWIDVSKPWVGAPIKINDSLTISSNRVGISNEIWKVRPAEGGIFFEDRIRFNGIIANVGLRFTYWTAGAYADQAISNPNNTLPDLIRKEYMDQTVPLFGRRWKARLLPNLRVSFPVTDNNVLYFNYSHTLRTQHPRFLYTGLDPKYLSQSSLGDMGNPNLNPETTVSYEVGFKSKLGKNSALTVTAFYKDQFDFVINRVVQVRNKATGLFEDKLFAVNQDYARIRGLEISYMKKIGTWFNGSMAASYTIATGKSNSAYESMLNIKTNTRVDANKENYLVWDRPFDIKGTFIFKGNKNSKIWKIPLNGFTLTLFTNWRSGFRYTPMVMDKFTDYGRPEYVEASGTSPNSAVGANWFWIDMRLAKKIKIAGKLNIDLVFELKNLLNNKNAQIINPVTGRAYEYGDPVPALTRDPAYNYPTNTGLSPLNPARYLEPRQMLIGVNFNF